MQFCSAVMTPCANVVFGGAPLAYEVAEFFETVGTPVIQGWGLTEPGPLAATCGDHRVAVPFVIASIEPCWHIIAARFSGEGRGMMRRTCCSKELRRRFSRKSNRWYV